MNTRRLTDARRRVVRLAGGFRTLVLTGCLVLAGTPTVGSQTPAAGCRGLEAGDRGAL